MRSVIAPRSVLLLVVSAAAACGAQSAELPRRTSATALAPSPAKARPASAERSPRFEIGTAHPTQLLAAASDASWAALCQARADTDGDGQVAQRTGPAGALTGDRAQPYFIAGSGAGAAIDELLAVAPGGRFAAVRRGRRLILIDAHQ